jgi:hypothetical protein
MLNSPSVITISNMPEIQKQVWLLLEVQKEGSVQKNGKFLE